jgi:long-chain acyl-CoA synthetase
MSSMGSSAVPVSGFYEVGVLDPDRRALVDPAECSSTYGALLATVNQMSRGLQALGLAPGDTLAVVAGNRRETLELYAASVQIGLYVVLLNWHLSVGEVAYILGNSKASALIVEDRFDELAEAIAERAYLPPEARFAIGSLAGFRPLADLIDGQSDAPPERRRAGQAMFYTSGTTGQPKGVRKRLSELPPEAISMSSGIGLRRGAASNPVLLEPATEARVSIVPGPLYHAAPLAAAAGALDAGACLVLMERFDAERFLDLVGRYKVNTAGMVPTMFHRLLALPEAVRDAADVSSLHAISHAGAPCPIDVKQRMINWFGPIITEMYSSTEGMGTTVTAEEWLQRPGTVGQAAPGVTIEIVDEEGNRCPPGTPGLIYLSQTLWEFEYLGDAAKTEAARRSDLFTVGDIGYLDDDGYLFLCDRDSEVIISGGVNIYPAEVESIILSHPDVGDVAVIGVPSDEWGEEVRAVVEAKAGVAAGPALGADLIAFCRDRIAHYKCPRAVDFVESLARDPNGKVRKQPIRDGYWQGRPRRI